MCFSTSEWDITSGAWISISRMRSLLSSNLHGIGIRFSGICTTKSSCWHRSHMNDVISDINRSLCIEFVEIRISLYNSIKPITKKSNSFCLCSTTEANNFTKSTIFNLFLGSFQRFSKIVNASLSIYSSIWICLDLLHISSEPERTKFTTKSTINAISI